MLGAAGPGSECVVLFCLLCTSGVMRVVGGEERALGATVVDRVPWIDSPEGHVPSIPFEAPLAHPLISRNACLIRFPTVLA